MTNQELKPQSDEGKTPNNGNRWIVRSAAIVTFCFVVGYRSMLNATPHVSSAFMLFVICVGLLWAVSKLLRKLQRTVQ